MSKETIGDKLRKLREENEMPLRKVAALLDIDVSILSKMERGEDHFQKKWLRNLQRFTSTMKMNWRFFIWAKKLWTKLAKKI